MSTEFAKEEITSISNIIDYLFDKYNESNLTKLIETFDKINTIVVHNRIKAKEILNKQKIKAFNIEFCLDKLNEAFPQLCWGSKSWDKQGTIDFTGTSSNNKLLDIVYYIEEEVFEIMLHLENPAHPEFDAVYSIEEVIDSIKATVTDSVDKLMMLDNRFN